MKTPAFWYRPPGLASALLAPLGALYGLAGRRRIAGTVPRRVGAPVVCVGNLVAGGAGKTPVGLALIAALRDRGVRVHALTRGHGGRQAGPLPVEPARHTPADVGDEALLLAEAAPCWVARDRVAGAERAVAAGAGIIVMDDGFQNPALHKDLALIVADGAVGFGNGRLVPAGPLRERVADGLARADALVILGEDRHGLAALAGGRPVLHGRLEPDPQAAAGLAGHEVLAFAGIGRPEKFFATLEALGARVVERVSFADHHPYRPAEVAALIDRAAALGALPVTTAKDAVRLPPDLRGQVRVLPVSVRWAPEGAEVLAALLDPLLLRGKPDGEAA
ncbi:tetraacyldisaccharide 4'-kinase [Azospirillum thiophilum]|uniref:Tetraacyldisaccharide 4'-kinase n=1 Tax=Azospirillum thiophilum TaxID=528244 RepID=A0AAC8VV39_9PROT|nr:tetraacyldisaccharide 4'-kinase [Azospirillum thiophilum]ALG69756.1 tetraacyldisaccharide 4'-kinase [Azospirillum thiophilum]KJR66560.1 tetraacyldisaccharide 4'-kinase [Azospirillum thiophilum]